MIQKTACGLAIVACVYFSIPTLAIRTSTADEMAAAWDAPGNFNPLVPGYFADPTIEQFGDTFYLYATTDGNGGGRGPATVWVSRDFVNWVLVPMNWPTTPYYWAPDVVRSSDGRYYLYYNQPCSTYGAVSDTPVGPWTPLTAGDGLVIPDHLVQDVITLDTQVFTDKDGTRYGYWGTWGVFPKSGCGIGVFNADMKSFARLGMIPNTQAKDFFEAPFMIERDGTYYFTYSSGSCHDASYRVQYAVGNRPDGEFTMGPNNPILESTADGTVHGPGHHSILKHGDDYYIIYHRHDIPMTPNGMHRQTCADRLEFEGKGVIKKVRPTHRGVGPLGPQARGANLTFQRPVTASSQYCDTLRNHDYQPAYAVDDNNATLWRPGDNRMGHWLTVDLGTLQRVCRTETQFEYGTWYYQYLIESSPDGQTWETFADRRQNTRWGSPLVDDGDVEARFLRLTITGTELPGLFGAVWNFKAFSDAPADPLLALADRSFDQYVVPRTRGGADIALAVPVASVGPDTAAAISAPLILLDASRLQLGAPLPVWANAGSLGGEFRAGDVKPVVDLAGGRKAVRFSGSQILTASFPAPRSLAGNSSFSVAAWVHNPAIGESECLVSWAGRGGPDATTAQFGYGSHREFGAVGHWGFADLGFREAAPKADSWHHLAVVFDGVIERVYVDGQLDNAEAKMLLMHEGRPIYVGASEPGTEYLDGFLASLRVYDQALSESQVRELANDAPDVDVLVHVDSARLDYGPLASWANSGSLGGAFETAANPPQVRNVEGRIAVSWEAKESLELVTDAAIPLTDFSLVVGVANASLEAGECAVEFRGTEGTRSALLSAPPTGGWHQVTLVYRGGAGTFFVDGNPTTRMAPSVPTDCTAIRLGSANPTPFTGALTRVQLFQRALSVEEVAQLYALWKNEWQTPQPNPAAFAQPPKAVNTGTAVLRAQPGQSEVGPVAYRFSETTGRVGGSSSGWIPQPFFVDDGLQPDTRYSYAVTVRDPLGNVTQDALPVEVATDAALFAVFADPFSVSHDFLVQGRERTIWDGCLGTADSSAPENVVAEGGTLRLQSRGTVWDGGRPLGAFLYKLATGDFVAEVRVADYAGLSTRRVPGNNDGGLMVRVPQVDRAGPGEDLLQLNFFPIWNQGNMVTNLDSGARSQKGNLLAWDAHRHLQIIRQGALFHFRTSADGVTWYDLPGSPVERRDMLDGPLQVGLYHASYGLDSGYVDFSDFRLTVRRDEERGPNRAEDN